MVVLHQIDEKLIILLTTTAPKRFHPKNFPSNHPYIPLTLHVLPLTPIILLTLSLSFFIFFYLSFISPLSLLYVNPPHYLSLLLNLLLSTDFSILSYPPFHSIFLFPFSFYHSLHLTCPLPLLLLALPPYIIIPLIYLTTLY